jgi:hypothetical protein
MTAGAMMEGRGNMIRRREEEGRKVTVVAMGKVAKSGMHNAEADKYGIVLAQALGLA